MKPATRLPANNEGGTSLSHLTSRFCCHHHQKQGDSVEPPITTHFSPIFQPPFSTQNPVASVDVVVIPLDFEFLGEKCGEIWEVKS